MRPVIPPRRCSVLVVGGGPAGSLAAAVLAREGIDVVLLERAVFPRYHIGESLLPSIHPILEFAGAREKVDAHGFVRKHGGFFRLRPGHPSGHVDFRHNRTWTYSYQVDRAAFDKLLLDHARGEGVQVFEGTAVEGVTFEGDRASAATWVSAGAAGRIDFDHVLDASGAAGWLAEGHLRNRRREPAFANVAVGGYWRGARPYRDDAGFEHPGAFSMAAHADGSGWTWAIPLRDGTLSVGAVVHRDTWRRWRQEFGGDEASYAHALTLVPDVQRLLQGASREGPVRCWVDGSYAAECFAGPGFRMAGDAAAFIDPLFSTGVHLALLGGLAAAASIAAVARGDVDEAGAARFHDRFVRRAYTRFAIAVAGFYRQIDALPRVDPVVHGPDFREALDRLAPLLSGGVDLTGDVDPEALRNAMSQMSQMMLELLQLDTGNRLAELMARGFLDLESTSATEAIAGYRIRLERGALGLRAAP